jgi:ribosomal protein L2
MAVKTYKPYTPSRRFMVWYDFSDITTNKPEKSLQSFWEKLVVETINEESLLDLEEVDTRDCIEL